MTETTETFKGTRGWWEWIPRLFFFASLTALVAVRSTAHSTDFAVANLLTGLFSILAWLSLTVALAWSAIPRLWWRGAHC